MSAHLISFTVDGSRRSELSARRLRARAPGDDREGCTPPSPSDEQLLEAVGRDLSALATLYDRHSKLVYGLALTMLGSREEAEDLTQEVFVAICGPNAYDRDRGSVSAFLITMTRSRALDRLRRRHRSARLLKTWHESELAAPAPRPPCEDVSMRRAAERVRAVLADLPEIQRQVLEMAYYRGLSQTEIAAQLDTPLGTVKSRLRRALIALSEALEDLDEAASGRVSRPADERLDDVTELPLRRSAG